MMLCRTSLIRLLHLGPAFKLVVHVNYPVAATDHRWQLTGKPRHQYQYDPFQQAWSGRL
jgi:hypothetical protein